MLKHLQHHLPIIQTTLGIVPVIVARMDSAKYAAAVGIIPACCATAVVSFWLGRYKARSVHWAIALGASAGLIFAGMYFTVALVIETLWKGWLVAPWVGIGFVILCVVAPLSGALAALRGHSI
jgi:hypothetical protein